MLPFTRRWFLLGTAGLVCTGRGFAQTGQEHHGGLYEGLQTPGRIGLPDIAATQHVFDSPVPKATQPGRWVQRASLPLLRSEMAWAEAYAGTMHLVGGYAENRTPHAECFVFDIKAQTWQSITPIPQPCGAIACVALDGNIHAVGGAIGPPDQKVCRLAPCLRPAD
jgi:hypothetical protein